MFDLTLDTERRAYERTVRITALTALNRLFPGQKVRMEYSVSSGIFIRLPGRYLTQTELTALEEEMRAVVAQDLPIETAQWSRADAIAWFGSHGREDLTALLRTLRTESVTVTGCDGLWDECYGETGTSTGCAPVFTLVGNFPGFVLQLPNADYQDRPAPFACRPKHLNVFAQSASWCGIMGVNNAADIAALMEHRKMREFIRVNEALHDSSIDEIARAITAGGKRVVLVAGPSSSGKTTFAARLGIHLRVQGRPFVRVSMDDYYLDRDAIAPGPDGKVDLEALDTLDVPLLREQLQALVRGEEVEIPRFNFKAGKR